MDQSSGFSAEMVERGYNDPNQEGSSQQSSSKEDWIQAETWSSNEEYTAGGLKESFHGNDYQLKLLMLFASKCGKSEVAFRLATEMAEAEKFDDLVFRFADSQGDVKYRFLQAKHRQFLGERNKIKVSDLKSKGDNDFSLQMYFVSYVNDMEKKEFRDGVPQDFIICTNTGFDFETSTTKKESQRAIEVKSNKTWKAYFSEMADDDKVLNLGGKRYQFNKDPSIRTKIISELKPIFEKSLEKNKLSNDNVEKIEGFLDKLVFAVEQPSGDSLEQKIRDTIGNEFNIINNFIYSDFFKFMYDWMKHHIKNVGGKGKRTAHFLTEKDIEQFLGEAKKKIASLGLVGSTLLFERKIEKFGLKFKDDIKVVEKIREFLNKRDSEERILIVCSKCRLLTKIKVKQMVASHGANKIIFSDLKSLCLLSGSSVDPVRAFRSKERDYLIIEILSTLDEGARALLSSFYQVVGKEINKKVILIIQSEQKDNIQKLFEDGNYVKIIEDDDNKLKDLTSESKQKILEKEITLFGKIRKLSSLTTSKDDLYSAIAGDALTTLINGESNVIGSEHKYDFDTHIDILRTLTYHTMIHRKCLEENKHDLFAISGVEERDFPQLVPKEERRREFVDKDPNQKDPIRLIRLDNCRDVKKDFDQLCRDYKDHAVHLLENKDGALQWKRSHGSLFNLRRFVLKTEDQEKQIDDLTDSAIIAGEPGMGKSTILTTYAIRTDSPWPIRVNLKDYETQIDEANFGDLSGIVGFLSDVIDPASWLIKNLLECCLHQRGQVALLLDGYDEIKGRNREQVVRLLRTLRSTRGKVLITTRSSARSELEDALGIFAHSLNRFDENQQKEFLGKIWIGRLNVNESAQEKKVDKFAKQLLSHFHGLNLMKEDGLVGIVLQARMVAEIFQNGCKGYLVDENFNFYELRISNMFELFKEFMGYQYERYLKGRVEMDSLAPLTRSYTKAYGNLALKSLFSEDQRRGLLRKETSSGEELQDVGLVKIVRNDGAADFLHPTYAEYFAADLLVDALGKEEDHPKYRAAHDFLLAQIFRDRNKVIHDFIENKMKDESDRNLSRKWKAIQNCNLLKGVETEKKLHFSTKPYNRTSGKGLSEREQYFEEIKNGRDPNSEYYFSDYVKRFQKFMRDNKIENSEYGTNNGQTMRHYFTQLKQQDVTNRNDILREVIGPNLFSQSVKILNYLRDEEENKKEKHLKELRDLLIPTTIVSLPHLLNLSYLYYYLDIFYPDIIKRVKSYISFDQEGSTRIINSLKDMISISLNYVISELRFIGGSLFADALFQPGVIAHTKSAINDLYKGASPIWLAGHGVVISRFLEILTPEMVKAFTSAVDVLPFVKVECVYDELIEYIVNTLRVAKLPHIDRLAFLTMLVRFVGFYVSKKYLPSYFTCEQLKTTLKLFTDVLSEQRQPTLALSLTVEYLITLRKAGLKLIGAEKELLVIDPAGEFECKLSSDYMKQLIQLLKWKNENPSEPKVNFLNKCYEILDFRKGSLRRSGSETDLQQPKRLKCETCLNNLK